MTLRGVGPLEPGTVVIDVGGGSTELITESFRTSMNVGSVRLTERHGGDLEAMAADVRAGLPDLDAERVLGVDGTTAELAHLAAEGRTVRCAFLDETLAWLTSSSEAERRARLLEPDRSEVLAAGVVVLRESLAHLGVDRAEASDRDLLNGAALAAAELPDPEDGAAPPGAYTCC